MTFLAGRCFLMGTVALAFSACAHRQEPVEVMPKGAPMINQAPQVCIVNRSLDCPEIDPPNESQSRHLVDDLWPYIDKADACFERVEIMSDPLTARISIDVCFKHLADFDDRLSERPCVETHSDYRKELVEIQTACVALYLDMEDFEVALLNR